jgi:ferredoxin
MKVVRDGDLCQGHGMCVLESPSVFQLDKASTTVTLLQEELADALVEEVRQAVKYCPNAALSLQRSAEPSSENTEEDSDAQL